MPLFSVHVKIFNVFSKGKPSVAIDMMPHQTSQQNLRPSGYNSDDE